jgi:pilus assembly protein CpaB
MKPKTIALMVVAGGCGLVASIMTSKLLAERNVQAPTVAKVKVLRAKAQVPAFKVIKEPEKYFDVIEVDEGTYKKALGDLNDVKGQRFKNVLNEEAVVLKDDLLGTDFQSLQLLMEKGQRAIALRVSAESSAAGFVLPGSRVDIVSTVQRGSEPTSQIIMQDVLVLAVDGNFIKSSENTHMLGTTVTLAVTPEDGQRLALASSMGELRLTLRPLDDHERVTVRAAKPNDLNRQGDSGTTSTGDDEKVATAPTTPRFPLNPVAAPTTTPTQTEPTPVVKVEPPQEDPKKTHVMTLITGEYTTKSVFVWDDKEGNWSAPASSKSQPDEPAPSRKPQPFKTPAPAPIGPDQRPAATPPAGPGQ